MNKEKTEIIKELGDEPVDIQYYERIDDVIHTMCAYKAGNGAEGSIERSDRRDIQNVR